MPPNSFAAEASDPRGEGVDTISVAGTIITGMLSSSLVDENQSRNQRSYSPLVVQNCSTAPDEAEYT
jgi:hypothetical protein